MHYSCYFPCGLKILFLCTCVINITQKLYNKIHLNACSHILFEWILYWGVATSLKGKYDLWTFDRFQTKPLWKFGNITKAASFKGSFSAKLEKHTITFFMTVLFNIFMRQTADDSWGLHKNMNCAFPLR